MCEQTEVFYLEGDVVWVKLGNCWWPGQVKDFNKLSEDLRKSFKKPPMAVVKFFDEDSYEYVKNINNIYKYNCSRKHEFIKKGLDLQQKNNYMDKFPLDVKEAEMLTGGDPNILRQDIFTPDQRPNYAEIFGSPSPKKTQKKSKRGRPRLDTSKSPSGSADKQTPTRKFTKSSYEVTILEQTTTPPAKTSNYSCPYCGFHSSRLNVIVLHNKSHSAGYISSQPPKPKQKTIKKSKKLAKTTFAHTSSIDEDIILIRQGLILSTSEESDVEVEEEKPKVSNKRKSTKTKTNAAKKTKTTASNICSNLLADWGDSENEEETIENQPGTSEQQSDITAIQAETNEKQPETSEKQAEIIEKQTEISEKQPEISEEKSTEKLSLQSELLAEWEEMESNNLKKIPIDKTKTETNENGDVSCFDFEEEEETVLEKSPGRKIPRVIPQKRKSSDVDSDKLSDKELKKHDKIDTQEKEDTEEAFKNLLEETAVPELPSIENLKSVQNFQERKPIKSPDKQIDSKRDIQPTRMSTRRGFLLESSEKTFRYIEDEDTYKPPEPEKTQKFVENEETPKLSEFDKTSEKAEEQTLMSSELPKKEESQNVKLKKEARKSARSPKLPEKKEMQKTLILPEKRETRRTRFSEPLDKKISQQEEAQMLEKSSERNLVPETTKKESRRTSRSFAEKKEHQDVSYVKLAEKKDSKRSKTDLPDKRETRRSMRSTELEKKNQVTIQEDEIVKSVDSTDEELNVLVSVEIKNDEIAVNMANLLENQEVIDKKQLEESEKSLKPIEKKEDTIEKTNGVLKHKINQSESETVHMLPKKRFVRSFEDFEMLLHNEEKPIEGTSTSSLEVSKLKSQLMSKLSTEIPLEEIKSSRKPRSPQKSRLLIVPQEKIEKETKIDVTEMKNDIANSIETSDLTKILKVIEPTESGEHLQCEEEIAIVEKKMQSINEDTEVINKEILSQEFQLETIQVFQETVQNEAEHLPQVAVEEHINKEQPSIQEITKSHEERIAESISTENLREVPNALLPSCVVKQTTDVNREILTCEKMSSEKPEEETISVLQVQEEQLIVKENLEEIEEIHLEKFEEQTDDICVEKSEGTCINKPEQIYMQEKKQLQMEKLEEKMEVTNDSYSDKTVKIQETTFIEEAKDILGKTEETQMNKSEKMHMDKIEEMDKSEEIHEAKMVEIHMTQTEEIHTDEIEEMHAVTTEEISMNKSEEICMVKTEEFHMNKLEEIPVAKSEDIHLDITEGIQMDKTDETLLDKIEEMQSDNIEETHVSKTEEICINKTQDIHMDKTEGPYLNKTEAIYMDKIDEKHTDKTEEIHVDKNEEIFMDKPEEINVEKTEETLMNKNEEIHLDKPEEISKDKTEEMHKNKTKEIQMDNTEEFCVEQIGELQMAKIEKIHMERTEDVFMEKAEDTHEKQIENIVEKTEDIPLEKSEISVEKNEETPNEDTIKFEEKTSKSFEETKVSTEEMCELSYSKGTEKVSLKEIISEDSYSGERVEDIPLPGECSLEEHGIDLPSEIPIACLNPPVGEIIELPPDEKQTEETCDKAIIEEHVSEIVESKQDVIQDVIQDAHEEKTCEESGADAQIVNERLIEIDESGKTVKDKNFEMVHDIPVSEIPLPPGSPPKFESTESEEIKPKMVMEISGICIDNSDNLSGLDALAAVSELRENLLESTSQNEIAEVGLKQLPPTEIAEKEVIEKKEEVLDVSTKVKESTVSTAVEEVVLKTEEHVVESNLEENFRVEDIPLPPSPKKMQSFTNFSMDFSDSNESIPPKKETEQISKIEESTELKPNLTEIATESKGKKIIDGSVQERPTSAFHSFLNERIVREEPSEPTESLESEMAKLTDTQPEMEDIVPEKTHTSSAKLFEILTDSKNLPKKFSPKNLISPSSNAKVVITGDTGIVKKFDSKTSKFIIKSTSKTLGVLPDKPVILSEKIIKPVTETDCVSVRKISSKRTYQDVEDIDTFIIQKPSKKSNVSDDMQDIILTPKLEAAKQCKGSRARGKPKIIEQTIIKAADVPESQEAGPLLDDSMFDINSMPIVLSDEILTPETIENMPVVMSEVIPVSTPIEKPAIKRGGTLQQVKLLNKPKLAPVVTQAEPKMGICKNVVQRTLAKNQKVYQSASTKILKNNPAVITQPGKPGKFIILPSTTSGATGSKYTVGKRLAIKNTTNTTITTPSPTTSKVKGIPNEPTGNKIMILTNNQGVQSRVLLTPTQQKQLLSGKMTGTKITKGQASQQIKGSLIHPKSILTSKGTLLTPINSGKSCLSTQTLISSKGQLLTAQGQTLLTSEGQVLTPLTPQQLRTIKTDKGRKIAAHSPSQRIILPEKSIEGKGKIVMAPKPKTIVIKGAQGQTIKKFTSEPKNVYLPAQKSLSAQHLQAAIPGKQLIVNTQADKISISKPVEKLSIPRLSKTPIRGPPKKSALLAPATTSVTVKPTITVPPLAPITGSSSKKGDIVAEGTSSEQKHLIIQDALGNQTTVTEGQILALPSEAVDGQPQSYMLVTVDESGNLAPISNETLMSLDPSLGIGGDMSNIVLQFDQQNAEATASEPKIETEPQRAEVQEKVVAEDKKIIVEQPQSQMFVTNEQEAVQTPPLSEQTTDTQTVACNISTGETSRQLIITGDPESTEKFLASLSEGNTDLSSLLTGTEGNIIINTDGQQILLNTDSENQILLMPTSTEGEISQNMFVTQQQIKNQDILAAALADTDVFQQETTDKISVTQEITKVSNPSQLSPNSSLYPLNVGNVLETSLTLGSPIMTPLEVPSNKKIKHNIESTLITQVPSSLELPITITDPSISQTVSQQVMLGNELQTNLELPISLGDGGITSIRSTEMNSPNFVYSLPTLEDNAELEPKTSFTETSSSPAITSENIYNSTLTGSMSMPLLTEDPIETEKNEQKDTLVETQSADSIESILPSETLEDASVVEMTQKMTNELDPIVDELELQTSDICDSLSEPPGGMFEKSGFSLGDSYLNKETENSDIQEKTNSLPVLKENSDTIQKPNEAVDFEEKEQPIPTSEVSSPRLDIDETSCEIPVQPTIVTNLPDSSLQTTFGMDVNRKRESNSDEDSDCKRTKLSCD